MADYCEYLAELKSATIFQDIDDEALIELLETMSPEIVRLKAGEKPPLEDFRKFLIVLRSSPPREIQSRRFKYDMPKFGEPGMMMAEIPSLSRFMEFLDRPLKMPGKGPPCLPRDFELECLLCSADMMVKFYNEKVSQAQSIMLRNFLGLLAQKVMDVRSELFLLRDGVDIYNA
jgi:hypothetical protein